LADKTNNSAKKDSICRTALLCKADLLTNLVYEFTELEGYIGADYALQTGETEEVAQGIKEHYFPLGADSQTAQGIEGQLVGIADKIDTVVTTFAVGKKPTGSADPLGISRATLGVIYTILNNNLKIDISKIIKKTIDLAPVEISDKRALQADIEDFFTGRLKIMFQQNYRHDLIDATCEVGNPLSDICDLKIRLEVIKELCTKSDFSKFNDAINRIIRIIKDEKGGLINEKLLLIDAEKNLYTKVLKIDEKALSYENLIKELFLLEPFIGKFFDDVLVMDKDEAVKSNRISLLALVKSKFAVLADFSKIVA